MKKYFTMILAMLLSLSLVACTSEQKVDDEQDANKDSIQEESSDSTQDENEDSTQEEAYQPPYVRIAGYAQGDELPLALWVDFDPANDDILKVTITGYGNPDVMNDYNDLMTSYYEDAKAYVGKNASDIKEGTDELSTAIYNAVTSYVNNEDKFVIRPYQSIATEKYIVNNPYIVDNSELTGDVSVNAEIVAQYPSDAVVVLNEDVMSGDKLLYPAGQSILSFKKADETEYKISTQAFKTEKPGYVVVAYTYGDMVIYDALDIYQSFTDGLEGADAYGKVISINETEKEVTYRTLGDKAMNYGTTAVDVTIDKETNLISNVNIYEHSDSTYLANSWEYGGGFVEVGKFIYDIDAYAEKFVGHDVSTPLTPYELTSEENEDGGSIVDGGVDMVVSGATRTPNAVLRGVNAAIEAYNQK